MLKYIFTSPRGGVLSIVISMSVCLISVCPLVYFEHDTAELHHFLCVMTVQWLGPPPAALRYVMYFQFVDDVFFHIMGLTARYVFFSPKRREDNIRVETTTSILTIFIHQ